MFGYELDCGCFRVVILMWCVECDYDVFVGDYMYLDVFWVGCLWKVWFFV